MRVQVYSQTTVHDAQGGYQLAIVQSETGERRLLRLPGDRAKIGDWIDLPKDRAPCKKPEDDAGEAKN